MSNVKRARKFPDWLRKSIPQSSTHDTTGLLSRLELHTVCSSARCPNRPECYAKKRATFLILGDVCTRDCTFCAVSQGEPQAVDASEADRIVTAIGEMQLRHVVLTSVTRDDLPDGGASHFVACVEKIKAANPLVSVEVLTPDFNGAEDALTPVAKSPIDIFNHNVETVPRLYTDVRPQAVYDRSLRVLSFVKNSAPRVYTKSGIMVGLGETEQEVYAVIDNLVDVSCDIITIGQYLQPVATKAAVREYVAPEIFERYKEYAQKKGCRHVFSGPYVRSSYNAEEVFTGVQE